MARKTKATEPTQAEAPPPDVIIASEQHVPPETLRDRFAMAAITGLLACEVSEDNTYTNHSGETREHWLAVSAYEIADAMMERRKL